MQIIKRNRKKILIIISTIIIISLILLKKSLIQNKKDNIKDKIKEEYQEKEITIKNEKIEKQEEKIYVDIKGAIKAPGVYELEKESRTIDLIKLAGGLTETSDTTYINLAQKLKDEMVVIIYTKEQIKKAKEQDIIAPKTINNTCICPKITNDVCITSEKKDTPTKQEETKEENQNKKININTATIEELQTLTGVGESKAKTIIEYREKNGNFEKKEDIKNVTGIGESLYEKIKDNITV